jgi:phosphoserine aminotransferase
MSLPWKKLDVVTFSWQKVLGGEAQHGILVMSKRAIDRLKIYNPPWPIPKLFRITKEGKLQKKIFQGNTINTPSLICIEDAIDALNWVKKIGGLNEMINRSINNLKIIEMWVSNTKWIDFVAEKEETRSSTSICLKIVDPWFNSLSNEDKINIIQFISENLAKNKVAYDINSYPSAPSGIRIWGGGTIEKKNIELLLPWLDWVWQKVKIKYT